MSKVGTKANIIGFGISRITMGEALERAGRCIREGGNHYILASNVHTVMTSQADPVYRKINNAADIALPDGKPLVWAVRLLEKARLKRISGRDFMRALCAESVKRGYSHFFLGGRESVLEALVARLKADYPGIKVAGRFSPPFRAVTGEEDAQIVEMINASRADIVWVGLGAPKQERWIGEHLGRVTSPVMVAVGAAFDFLAGNVKPAPRWMQSAGLEWLHRFGTEPRRLWRRYLFNNPRFIYLTFCQAFGLRKFPTSDDQIG